MIYDRLKELYEKGLELSNEIIELKRMDFDHRCSLQGNKDNDIHISDFHNSRIENINKKISELEPQLEQVNNKIKELS
jgi:hypothetical protein